MVPMVKVAEMVEGYLEVILGHWKNVLTTEFLEGLSSVFSATKMKVSGCKLSVYQIAMLYFIVGMLPIPCY